MRGAALLLSLSLAAAFPGCAREAAPSLVPAPAPAPVPPGPPAVALVVLPACAMEALGSAAVARAEVAATREQRERGLMGRDRLPEDTGMLFAYPEDRLLGFWMKNCGLPLAAAFLDRDGRILNIEEMAPGAGVPEADLPRHASKGEARYVLEMEGGWFARKGIRAGDRVDLAPALRGVEPR